MIGRLWVIAYKELLQLKRDKLTLAMMVVLPVMQLLLFGWPISLVYTSRSRFHQPRYPFQAHSDILDSRYRLVYGSYSVMWIAIQRDHHRRYHL